MARPETKTEVLVSSVFFDPQTPYTVLWGMWRLNQLVRETESDGIEVMPTRQIEIEVALGMTEGIRAEHQSPRTERGRDVFKREKDFRMSNRLRTLASCFLLPQIDQSFNSLVRIHKKVQEKTDRSLENTDRSLSAVLYPSAPLHRWETDRELAEKLPERLFQPCPEVVEKWQVKTPEDLIWKMRRRHYTGICFDTFHSRRPPFDNWRAVLPIIYGEVKEIHVSAGRVDIAGTPSEKAETIGDLEGLFDINLKTELNALLRWFYRQGWEGRVVIEIPPAGLAKYYQANILTPQQLTEGYRRVVENVREILLFGR